MEEYIRTIESDGVTYCLSTTLDGTTKIINIDIKPGVKTLKLKSFKELFITKVDIKDTFSKSFPDVEELYISKDISDILISNRLLPNVKRVISDSSCFLNGKNVLICKNHRYEDWTLINSFCKNEEEVIDLSNVINIKNMALDGCNTTNIIHTEQIEITDIASRIKGCKLNIDRKTGASMFGSILIQVSMSNVVEIPDDRFDIKFADSVKFSQNSEAIKIHRYETLVQLLEISIPSNIILENNDIGASECCVLLPALLNYYTLSSIEINESNPIYTTVDGILYTKDMKTLIKCPELKVGRLIIPDGVEVIADKAFINSNINSVVCPDSLISIKSNAFCNCYELNEIYFNANLEELGEGCFSGCVSLRNVVIPPKIKIISRSCFSSCPLEKLTLPDGLQTIDKNAFVDTIAAITIPGSVNHIAKHNFGKAESIKVSGTLTNGLLTAIMSRAEEVYHIKKIETSEGVIYTPVISLSNDAQMWLSNIENLPISVINDEIPYLFKFYIHNKGDIALELYENTHNKKAKDVLVGIAYEYALRLIKVKKEDDFVRLLKTGVIDDVHLKILLKEELSETDLPIATAYILEKTKDVNTDNKFSI